MLLNRESLKNLFKKGKFPTENHFAHLIDSTVNKVEDGFGKTAEEGMQFAPQGDHDSIMSIYERLDLPHPSWQLNLLREENAKGLSYDKVSLNEDREPVTESQLFLGDNGRIGIHTTQPWTSFDVNATASFKTRVGSYQKGVVDGDGSWKPILEKLNGVQAFEVVARIDGPAGKGKYAITHAIAVSAFGGRQARNRIRQTRAYYGWFWNRIDLKWEGDIQNYALKVRTRQHYGFDADGNICQIKYHITKLWDDSLFNREDG